MPTHSRKLGASTLAALLAATSIAFAQSAPPSTPAVKADSAGAAKPATPPSPVSGIRNKISAGDLLSAESILEVYRAKYGEDARYCSGLGWLARGALLLGDQDKAKRYAADVRVHCSASIAKGIRLDQDDDLAIALGAAIETDAQRVAREQGVPAATALVKSDLDRIDGPVSLRSRLYKRMNMLSMAGTRAPELALEDWIGAKPPTLASLQGKPVVVFIWAEGCGDSRAQAPVLARVKSGHAADGLQVVALTRYYEKEADKRATEKARADSVWSADYSGIGPASVVMSTVSMERYGGSSTPTLVFVDRKGVVRDYTPTRLTEAELERRIAAIVK